MKYTPILRSFSCLVLFFAVLNSAAAIDFREGSLEELRTQAAHEGKLYFVSFTAKWCAPCKLMQKYTFPDPTLTNYAGDNYLAALIDIESFDGVEYKIKYKVVTLPTILVFNSQGIEVGRFEKSMTASELLIGLKQFDSPENRVKKLKYMIPPVPRQVAFQTEVQPTHSAPKDNLSKKMPTGFGVQIGVFGNYSYAERAVTDFRFRFDEVLRIYETQLGGKEVFRIIAGKFEQKRKAKDFKEILSMMGVEGMVKDFSKLY